MGEIQRIEFEIQSLETKISFNRARQKIIEGQITSSERKSKSKSTWRHDDFDFTSMDFGLDHVQSLRDELSGLTREEQEMQNEIGCLQERLTNVSVKAEAQRRRVAEKEQTLKSIEDEISGVQAQLDRLNVSRSAARSELWDEQSRLRDLDGFGL